MTHEAWITGSVWRHAPQEILHIDSEAILEVLWKVQCTTYIMKGTEVPNPRRSSACDCTCVLTRIDHCLMNNSIMTFALELIWHAFRYQFIRSIQNRNDKLQVQQLYTAGIPLLEAYLLQMANNRTRKERLSQEQNGR